MLKSLSITNCYMINKCLFSVVSTHWVGYVHTDWLYLQHLTNKRGLKKHHTEEESTIGSEAQLRWELLECKWVPTSLENNTINRHRFSSRVTCKLLGQWKTAESKCFHRDERKPDNKGDGEHVETKKCSRWSSSIAAATAEAANW